MAKQTSGLQPGGFIALGALVFLIGLAVGAGGGSAPAGAALCVGGIVLVLVGAIAAGVRLGRRD